MDSIAWQHAKNDYTDDLRAAGRPATTIRLRRQHITQLARAVAAEDPWLVTARDLLDWFARETWARETRHSVRSSVRSFYTWAVDDGRLEQSPADRLPAVSRRPPRPRPTPDDVYREALAAVDDRERLALRLSAELGLRRGEVVLVHASDLLRGHDGWSLIVHGKGDRERVLPITDDLAREVLERCGGGYAFPGQVDGHLSPLWMGQVISKALPPGWSMHSLRHRFATRAYAVDRDLVTVQELLGHGSPETTRRYILTDHDRLRRTVEALGPGAA